MDKVFVKGLRADAFIGVYDWEHEQTQPLLIDLTMAWDQQAAGASDALADALDYDTLSKAVVELVQSRPRQLIETVAAEIATLILDKFNVPTVTVRVEKPQALAAATTVGVEITRSNA